jgi:hypothetical protein
MRFILTKHAEVQRLQREVSDEDIFYVLYKFHLTVPGDDDGTGLFATVPQGDTVILWIDGKLPLIEPVIIKTVVRRGK